MAHQPVRQEHDGVMQLPQAPDYESCQDFNGQRIADAGEECNAVVVPQLAYVRPFAEYVGVDILAIADLVPVHHFIRDPFCFGHLKTPFCELELLNHHLRGLSSAIFAGMSNCVRFLFWESFALIKLFC